VLSVATTLGVIGTVSGLHRNWRASMAEERRAREALDASSPMDVEGRHGIGS
jgi:hypothetical protein